MDEHIGRVSYRSRFIAPVRQDGTAYAQALLNVLDRVQTMPELTIHVLALLDELIQGLCDLVSMYASEHVRKPSGVSLISLCLKARLLCL